MFELIPVVSSQIKAMGHDLVHNVMRVKFNNGAVYDYQNVAPSVFEAIKNSESVGATFNTMVKAYPAAYPFSKVV